MDELEVLSPRARRALPLMGTGRMPVTGLAMSSDAGLHWTYANVPTPE